MCAQVGRGLGRRGAWCRRLAAWTIQSREGHREDDGDVQHRHVLRMFFGMPTGCTSGLMTQIGR